MGLRIKMRTEWDLLDGNGNKKKFIQALIYCNMAVCGIAIVKGTIFF